MIQQEKELLERFRVGSALGQMAITIAHEIRNLLGGIELCAEMLALELKDDLRRQELVQGLLEGIQALNGIVTNLLTFARPCRPSFARVSLHTLLEEALVYSRYALRARGITLVKAFSLTEPEILADRELLKQVFFNLILNGVQAMPQGGTLTITTHVKSLESGPVEVEIADTGCGIPPEHLPRIFEPFFTTKARGTGLGLALVRRILDHHRASIQVTSEPGRGTVFTVVFPDPMALEEVIHVR